MFSSWIVCGIASFMLSNLVWEKSLIELFFSYFTANNGLDFRKAPMGSNIFMSDNAAPVGKAHALANVVIERLRQQHLK